MEKTSSQQPPHELVNNSKQFDVPDEVDSYPDAIPPRNRKRDIDRTEDFEKIDTKVKKAPKSKAESYKTLLHYLTEDLQLQTDVEKLRAIFTWMGNQSIQNRKFPAGEVPANTPLGYMKLIKEKTGTCATFFTHLCRKAGIPCVIIHGIAKGADYEPGMDQKKCTQLLRNSWTAVYVSMEWRFIFPSFADVSSFGWERNNKERYGDYFFLTDPEEFIYFALPDQPKWQLLDIHWSSQKFIDAPMCRPLYFLNDLKITSQHSCILRSEDGECIVSLQLNEGMRFNYDINYNNEQSGRELSKDIKFNKYVFVNRTNADWELHVRFPEIGVYRLQILGGKALFSNEVICDFRLVCGEIKDDISPLPVNPTIGFGPSAYTEEAGFKVVSHKEGMVNATLHQKTQYEFALTKDVYISYRFVHNNPSSDELREDVNHEIQDTPSGTKSLKFGVKLKEPGECVFQIYGDDKEGTWDEKKNSFNFLINCFRPENPTQKKARKNLQVKAEAQDIKGLEAAVKRFIQLNMKDKRDLTRARKELEFLKVRQALIDAINRRHLETLKKALSDCRVSKCAGREQIKMYSEKAEKMRTLLESYGKICHPISSMDHRTISELSRYGRVPSDVQTVMRAVYLLLGEAEKDVETWDKIMLLIRKIRHQTLLYRLKHFDITSLKPAVVKKVRGLVMIYDETHTRRLGPVVGTFLDWLKNVITLAKNSQMQHREDNN